MTNNYGGMTAHTLGYATALETAAQQRGPGVLETLKGLCRQFWGGEEQAGSLVAPKEDCADCQGSGLKLPPFLKDVKVLAKVGSDEVVGTFDDYILCGCVLTLPAQAQPSS